jgi:hypothetical protein
MSLLMPLFTSPGQQLFGGQSQSSLPNPAASPVASAVAPPPTDSSGIAQGFQGMTQGFEGLTAMPSAGGDPMALLTSLFGMGLG